MSIILGASALLGAVSVKSTVAQLAGVLHLHTPALEEFMRLANESRILRVSFSEKLPQSSALQVVYETLCYVAREPWFWFG